MKTAAAVPRWVCPFILVDAMCLISYGYGGESGLIGMALGLAGAAVGVAGLILVTRLAGVAASAGAKPSLGVLLTAIVFFAKIPLFFALWTLAQSLGGSAPGCFLAGILLVYSGLVAWAVSR